MNERVLNEQKPLLVDYLRRQRLTTAEGIRIMASIIVDHAFDSDALESLFQDMRDYHIERKKTIQ